MSQRREALAVTACCIGMSMSSCTFHPATNPSLTIHKDIDQATVLTGAPRAGEKPLSAANRDSDCVLTTGDIHLWCTWISRYY
jgi:hypothetical protein